MGVLSDLVVIPEQELSKLLAADVPSEQFDGVDLSGVMPETLAALHEVVLGVAPAVEAYEPIASAGEEGPWISRIADPLVAALAQLDTAAVTRAAAAWLAQGDDAPECDADEAIDLLDAICEQARRAKPGDAMFLWVSL